MTQTIIEAMRKPPLYTKSTEKFWDDEYISRSMLDAHINPDIDAASRNSKFIDRSVKWISEIANYECYQELIDIGCGPGLYAKRFAEKGYNVTGIDYSKRSIEYAKNEASKLQLNINYMYMDYLKMNLHKQFDICTLIYCDYGALSTEDRYAILNNVYGHLKPGGLFLFDVFTPVFYNNFKEEQFWNLCSGNGFWRADEHLEICGKYKYPDNVTLSLNNIVAKDGLHTYYIWDTYFTKESLLKEVTAAGFELCNFYGNVAGDIYDENSDTMAVLLRRI